MLECQKPATTDFNICLPLTEQRGKKTLVNRKICKECGGNINTIKEMTQELEIAKQPLRPPGRIKKVLSFAGFVWAAIRQLIATGTLFACADQRSDRLNTCRHCPKEYYQETDGRGRCFYGCGCWLEGKYILSLVKYAVASCKWGCWEGIDKKYLMAFWRTKKIPQKDDHREDLLSIIIVSRCEKLLNKTLGNLLERSRGPIEIIVIADGPLYEPIAEDSRIKIYYHDEPQGRRPSSDEAVSYASGKYLLHIDAHVKTDCEGYDLKLKAACPDNKTMICVGLDKLIVEEYRCKGRQFGHKYITSKMKDSFSGIKPKADYEPTICGNGMGWFLPTDYYKALGGCDKTLSKIWGSFGLEWALKVWLSDPDGRGPGQVLLSREVVFAHYWQGAVPYKTPGAGDDRDQLKKWLDGTGENQVRPFAFFETELAHLISWHKKGHKKPLLVTRPTITVVMNTNGLYPELIEEAIESFIIQDYPNKKLQIISTSNKIVLDKDYEDIQLKYIKPFERFPEQLAFAIKQVESDYWTVMDSDDIYFSRHLTQLMEGMIEAQRTGLQAPCYVINPHAYQQYKGNTPKIRHRGWWSCLYTRVDPGLVEKALVTFLLKSKKDTGFDLHFIKKTWWNKRELTAAKITALQRLGVAFHIRRSHDDLEWYKKGLQRAASAEPWTLKPKWRKDYEMKYDQELPAITVLLNTFGRSAEMLGEAIESFNRQDYPNKRLLIICTRPDPPAIELEEPGNIKIIFVEDFDSYVDQVRYGIQQIETEFFCPVDDDDIFLQYHVSQLYRRYIAEGEDGPGVVGDKYFKTVGDLIAKKDFKRMWWNGLYRTKPALKRLGDPDMNGWDKRFLVGVKKLRNIRPSYIFRRNIGLIHVSKPGRNSHNRKAERIAQAKKLAYENSIGPVKVRWVRDYEKMAANFKKGLPQPKPQNCELDELAYKHGTDKSSVAHNYAIAYEQEFAPIRSEPIRLLEIGVKEGASLKLWRDYFSKARIYGIDIMEKCKAIVPEIPVFIGDQGDAGFLKRVAASIAATLDIIIDDGSHACNDQLKSFETLWPHVAPGGVYIIEDLQLGFEGVYQKHPEKRAYENITSFLFHLAQDIHLRPRATEIASIKFYPEIVFIRKKK